MFSFLTRLEYGNASSVCHVHFMILQTSDETKNLPYITYQLDLLACYLFPKMYFNLCSTPKLFVMILLVLMIQQLVVMVRSAELLEKSIVHDNLTRWFLEYRPVNDPYTDVVILLYGGTQSMRTVMNRGNRGTNRWTTLSDMYGFVLLIPNGVNLDTGDTYGDDQSWSDIRILNGTGLTTYDDVGFISQLVQQYTINEPDRDPTTRVYVTGSSNGGLMTYTLLLYAPELFTAGAAFIANLPISTSSGSESIPYPNRTTPIMIMNGNKDRLMKWDGGMVPSEVGGVVRSAHETRDFWIQANHALSNANVIIYRTLPNLNWLDRCRIRSEYYPADTTTTNNSNDTVIAAPVHFYEMDGGGHSIPSRRGFFSIGANLYDLFIGGPSCHDANGADLAWDFFMTHS